MTSATRELSQETLRVIVFTLGDYYFALPINAIIQVTESPSELIQHFDGLGLVTLENRSIMLLNLHDKLKVKTDVSETVKGEFLILTQTRQGDLCGIPIDVLPNMMELSYSEIQPLPQVYRQTNLYGIARFVTFVQREDQQQKDAIYLLDIDEAVRFLR